ncbi:MAG: pilus assembly protein [Lachnospiraceae bacterium]|nr:pilus assembly protein [Lachnospiraceae bacterium]
MTLDRNSQFHTEHNDGKNRSGMVTIEVVISFTVFLVVVAGVIYFTNIFIVHNKVQFAINSAAHEIAAYTYLYEALGARNAEKTMEKDMGEYAENVDDTVTQVTDTMNKISGLYETSGSAIKDAKTVTLDTDYIAKMEQNANAVKEAGGAAYDSGKASAEKIQGLFEDPSGSVVGIIYMAVNGASYYVKSLGAKLAAQALTEKYLRQGDLSGDQFLRGFGVKDGYKGLDFSGSTMFCDEDYRTIDLVVEYDIHVGFLGLILSDPNIHMVQRVCVSAWVGDNGVSKHSAYLKGKSIKEDSKKEDKKEEKKEEEDPRGAALDEKHFPDKNFRSLAKSYDKNNDGFLSKDETENVNKLLVHQKNYSSFKGIEYFQNLSWVNPFSNPLTDPVDLSKNTQLKHADLPDTNTDFYDLSASEPMREMVESGNYSKYFYYYRGIPCVKFTGSNGAELYIERTGMDVIIGDYKYDEKTTDFVKFK